MFVTKRDVVKSVFLEIDKWLSLYHIFLGWGGVKVAVRFEDLASPDFSRRREAVERLLSRTLGAPAPDEVTLDEIYNLAKESQKSRTRHEERLAKRIRSQVQKWDLDYENLLQEIKIA